LCKETNEVADVASCVGRGRCVRARRDGRGWVVGEVDVVGMVGGEKERMLAEGETGLVI
jgi:hypothetical protein